MGEKIVVVILCINWLIFRVNFVMMNAHWKCINNLSTAKDVRNVLTSILALYVSRILVNLELFLTLQLLLTNVRLARLKLVTARLALPTKPEFSVLFVILYWTSGWQQIIRAALLVHQIHFTILLQAFVISVHQY